MPWYVAAYLADTQHLSTLQHGAYCLLLMTGWKRGGRLPDSDEQLANIAKLPMRQWLAMRGVIAEFFDIEGGFWIQKRQADEYAKAVQLSAKRSGSGAIGGLKSAEVRRSKIEANASANAPPNGAASDQANEQATAAANAEQPAQQNATPIPLPTPPTSTSKSTAEPSLSPPLPGNLTERTFEAWRQHRREKGAPMLPTEEAVTLAKLREHADPEGDVQRAITAGFRRIDPPAQYRANGSGNGGQPRTRRDEEADNVKVLTGKKRDERTFEGTAERVGGEAVPALPGDLREPRTDDVGRR